MATFPLEFTEDGCPVIHTPASAKAEQEFQLVTFALDRPASTAPASTAPVSARLRRPSDTVIARTAADGSRELVLQSSGAVLRAGAPIALDEAGTVGGSVGHQYPGTCRPSRWTDQAVFLASLRSFE